MTTAASAADAVLSDAVGLSTRVVVDVVMPALDEEKSVGQVIEQLPRGVVRRVVVADNGSTDATAAVARAAGAQVVAEPERGYGVACLRALAHLKDDPPDVVAFLDADLSDHPAQLVDVLRPIVDDEADLVIGSRVLGQAQRGSLTPVQRFGNALSTTLLRLFFGVRFTDLGPFRAIRWEALRGLEMTDRDWGWTVQMQARAAARGLRCREVAVDYRKRIGKSKISGTLRGVVNAGTKILVTLERERRLARRLRRRSGDVLLFTRIPEPGRTKTRMIPALGEQGAADLQRDMTRFVLRRLAALRPHVLLASSSGGTPEQEMARARGVFGPQRYAMQVEGDLGAKLQRRVRAGVQAGRDPRGGGGVGLCGGDGRDGARRVCRARPRRRVARPGQRRGVLPHRHATASCWLVREYRLGRTHGLRADLRRRRARRVARALAAGAARRGLARGLTGVGAREGRGGSGGFTGVTLGLGPTRVA